MGAGFSLAMRDLEIRGAGNLLGTQQSGHIATVGYELYCRLLETAVRGLKQMPPAEPPPVNIDLPGRGLAAAGLRARLPGQDRRLPPALAGHRRAAGGRPRGRAFRPLRPAARRGPPALRLCPAPLPGDRPRHRLDHPPSGNDHDRPPRPGADRRGSGRRPPRRAASCGWSIRRPPSCPCTPTRSPTPTSSWRACGRCWSWADPWPRCRSHAGNAGQAGRRLGMPQIRLLADEPCEPQGIRRGLLLQGPRRLPVLQRPPHGPDRGPDGRIARIRYVLPRHKAATWVGPGRGRKATRPGANAVVELTPPRVPRPARRSRPAAAEAPASLPRGVCVESQAEAGRHGAGSREHRQAARCRCRWACGQYACHGLLRHSGKAPLARHLPDCVSETHGPAGRGVPARVPSLRRRHPADRRHHGAGAHPQDSHPPG